MTTMAYRDGQISADSLGWNGDICMGSVIKVGRMEDGSLWGVAGNLQYLDQLKKWAAKPEGDPPETKDTDFFMVCPDGHVRIWEGVGWCELKAPFFAIGSGSSIALGAMHMGATAAEAVHAASCFDAFTGGEIVSFQLDQDAIAREQAQSVQVKLDGIDDITPEEIEAEAVISEETWREKLGL